MANYNKINVFEIGEELKEVEKLREYATNESRQEVDIKFIDTNPYQPRKIFDEVKLQVLKHMVLFLLSYLERCLMVDIKY